MMTTPNTGVVGEKRKLPDVIVCSLNDPAGTNIRERLLEAFPFKDTGDFFDSSPIYSWRDKLIVSSRKDIIYTDNLDEKFGDRISKYVFISRHKAESGIPSLTAHFTGNFGPATFGGNPKQIAKYTPTLLKNYLVELKSRSGDITANYSITLEATHHGPTALNSPVLFVELGSTDEQWKDTAAASVIAKALVASLDSTKRYRRFAIGIGGTHYPEKMNGVIFDSDVALGPIVPEYALEHFDLDLLKQILSKNEDDQEISMALIDYKGLGKFKDHVLSILDSTQLERIDA